MKKGGKVGRVGAAAGAAALVVAGWTPAAEAQVAPSTTSTTVQPPAAAELLVDLDSGKALIEQNAHTPLPPGSLTKMLTAMVAVGWLPSGPAVPVSDVAANAAPNRVDMKPGQTWPFDEVMHALLIASANDAAYALAERVSGSLAGFAVTMQDAARQIGMVDHPVLEDPAGLDGSEGFDGGNRISAWDLAIAGRDMMANPQLAAIAGTLRYVFTDPSGTVQLFGNQNGYFLRTYAGAVGVKTGYTDAAGFCVVEEAARGGRHLMAVVLNGKNSYATAADLLDAGFSTPVATEPARAETLPPIVAPVPYPPQPASRPAPGLAGRLAGLGKPAPATLDLARSSSAHRQRSWPEAAAAAVMLIGIAVTWSRLRRNRRSASHSR